MRFSSENCSLSDTSTMYSTPYKYNIMRKTLKGMNQKKMEGGQSGTYLLTRSLIILQAFRCFTYVTVHSSTLPSLYLCHSSFSNPSVASPTLQFILQPFFRFYYVTSSSLNLLGELPISLLFTSPQCRSYTLRDLQSLYFPSVNYLIRLKIFIL